MIGGVLAIDHGTKRTGFAVADALRITSSPLEVFHGPGDSDELLDRIGELLDERDVKTFVLGLPYNMDGTEGPRAADVRAFGARLAQRFSSQTIEYIDERLSTKEAEHLARERRREGLPDVGRDALAALVLLREWLGAN